jgi:hypothetical protein
MSPTKVNATNLTAATQEHTVGARHVVPLHHYLVDFFIFRIEVNITNLLKQGTTKTTLQV